MSEQEVCQVCGQAVLVMCQKWTGYCSQLCQNKGDGE